MADERKKFEVSLVTPEGAAYEGLAEMIVVPGAAGEIGILARHAPLVAMLKAGSTRVHVAEGNVVEFATGAGFFKVEQDRALALVDDAVDAREIDTEGRSSSSRTQERSSSASMPARLKPTAGSSSSASATPRTS